MSATLTIQSLNAQGEGICGRDGTAVAIPFTLPGETVTAAIEGNRATLLSVKTPSPDRVAAPCSHFETCGGCVLQHMAQPAYRSWKERLVADALKARGLDAPMQPGWFCEARSRRRAVYAVVNGEDGMRVGFSRARSHEIIDLAECHVVTPAVFAAREAIKVVLAPFAPRGKPLAVTVTETLTGIDVAVTGPVKLAEDQRRGAARLVMERGIGRLAVNGDVILEPNRPLVDAGGVAVAPPPGGFLQAVKPAEDEMARLVLGHVGKAKRAADLFSGCGTFALRMARSVAVHAVEADAPALASLDRAFRDMPGLKPVTTEKRDLDRRPMTAAELKPFQFVVFDPPRAGAEAQARELARSTVKRIAAVSCNPLTLARDLQILIAGGYRLLSVTPLDQFLWSAHVEAVALLER